MNRVRSFPDAELSPEEKSVIRLLVSKKILDPAVWTTDNFTDAELLKVCKDALKEDGNAFSHSDLFTTILMLSLFIILSLGFPALYPFCSAFIFSRGTSG